VFIDLSQYSPLTIDPARYPTTLVIAIDAPDEQSGCGVFAGKYDHGFGEDERGQVVPVVEAEECGLKHFVLDRPECEAPKDQVRRWHYAVIGWKNAVYVEYPHVHEVVLTESYAEPCNTWHVSIAGVVLLLPDYEPGALARGVVKKFVQVALGMNDWTDLFAMLDDIHAHVRATGRPVEIAEEPLARGFGFVDPDTGKAWKIGFTLAKNALTTGQPRSERQAFTAKMMQSPEGRRALANLPLQT
jgi:hypothetical protein